MYVRVPMAAGEALEKSSRSDGSAAAILSE